MRIIIISGSPGAGKTTVTQKLVENSEHEKVVNIHLDDFWQFIRKGYIHPWLDGSGEQNETVIESVTASAEKFAAGGYEVFVEGAIGTWFIEPWLNLAKKGIDVRYIMLRPDKETIVSRVINREQNKFFPLTAEVAKNLWEDFGVLDIYESHVINNSSQTIDETAAYIQGMLDEGKFALC